MFSPINKFKPKQGGGTEISMLEKINSIIWGVPLILLMLSLGIYLSVGGGFFQIRRIGYVFKNTVLCREKGTGGVSVFESVWASVGSSVGVGNIAGVAGAVYAGGAGVLFWMIISAVLGMSIKFAEILLAAKYRKSADGKNFGGPMYYMRDGAGFKILPVIFSCLCIMCCLLMGNAVQSAEISEAAARLGISRIYSATAFTVISAFICIGGMKSIGKAASVIVPFMASFYIFGTIIAIIFNLDKLPDVLFRIVSEAFDTGKTPSWKIAVFYAMQLGFSRGIFSNESGLGTAPIAHAAAENAEGVRQAMWGIFEVVLDTLTICTLTGIAVLISGENTAHEAFGKLFFGGERFVDIAIIFFAFSTVIGWQYFGNVCLGYLTDREFKTWKIVYSAVTFLSMYYAGELTGIIWTAADCINGLMTFVNIIALFALSGYVIKEEKKILNNRCNG